MPKSAIPKRLKEIVRLAEQHGWTYDTTRSAHPRLSPPRGKTGPDGSLLAPVTFGKTPSDHASDRNGVAYLRRSGVPIPH